MDLVDAYARRVYPAILDQHLAESVSSPLGVWLLLAACASAAKGEQRASLERALGCSVAEATELLAALMADPPPALKAAMAVWIRPVDETPEFSEWADALPSEVETGSMPSKKQADEWAKRNTLGLIEEFPLSVGPFMRIVLASALATKVSWRVPFDVTPADEHLGESSPWRARVQRLLWDRHPGLAGIVDTRAAGLVAVHCAVAVEDLTVLSVSADPTTARHAVIAAAHEVIAHVRDRPLSSLVCSLFDLPLGTGHSWQIAEREVATRTPGERIERVEGVSLPAWRAKGKLDLQRGESFGSTAALEIMRALIGPDPRDEPQARQAAVAAFTRYGFEAAAITAFGFAVSGRLPPREKGVERTAILRFDHPYAAVAIAGRTGADLAVGEAAPRLGGLPLFTAWVHTPEEPEGDQNTDQRPDARRPRPT
ncbi:MAG: hypothetical protein JO304_21720 [Solirubrobacterales bacterium]|nr:hypothetical protein [Solirubrobacterales bacterium]